MKDQHKKIKGYRDLNQQEIDLMNELKDHAEKTQALIDKVMDIRGCAPKDDHLTVEQHNESYRCLTVAKESLQTGQMWLVRSVALPNSF